MHGNTKHGYFGTPTYQTWASMVARCRRDPAYAGIVVCERWSQFENFLEDMGERPKGMTLDRESNALGYNKDNCRWATRQTQAENRHHVKFYEHDGQSRTLADWSQVTGVSRTTLYRKVVDLGIPLANVLD